MARTRAYVRMHIEQLSQFQKEFVEAYENALCINYMETMLAFINKWNSNQTTEQDRESVRLLCNERFTIIRTNGPFNFMYDWQESMRELYQETGLQIN